MKERRFITRALAIIAMVSAAFSGWFRGIAPPDDIGKNSVKIAVALASILTLLAVVILMAIASFFLLPPRQRIIYLILGGICTALVVPSAIFYVRDYEEFVGVYPKSGGRPYVKGSELTSPAEFNKTDKHLTDDSDLLYFFSGNPSKVWTTASIEKNHLTLLREYIYLVIAIAAAIIGFAEAATGGGESSSPQEKSDNASPVASARKKPAKAKPTPDSKKTKTN